MNPHDQLLNTLKQITILDPEEELMFRQAFKPFSLKKNEYFLQSTNVNHRLGFLSKGLVRYFVFRNEEESTLEFTKEGEFIADYGSFISKNLHFKTYRHWKIANYWSLNTKTCSNYTRFQEMPICWEES